MHWVPFLIKLPAFPEIWFALRQSPQQLSCLFIRLLVFLDSCSPFLDRALVVLRKVFPVDFALRTGCNQLESFVSDDNGQAELQVHDATLASVFESGAGQADV